MGNLIHVSECSQVWREAADTAVIDDWASLGPGPLLRLLLCIQKFLKICSASALSSVCRLSVASFKALHISDEQWSDSDLAASRISG